MKSERDDTGTRDEPGLAEFERELQALLRISPSAGLAGRVRARLREPRPSRAWWLLPALAAGLAVLLWTSLMHRRPQPAAGNPRQAAVDRRPRVPAPIVNAKVPPARRHARPRVRPAPVVIVPAGQDAALLRYVAAVSERQAAPPAVADRPPFDEPLPPAAPILIVPLATEPLPDTAGAPARSDS